MTEQMPGELIYEYTIQSTGATSYGVPALDALLSGVADIPPQGARYDLAFQGPIVGQRLRGTIELTDYIHIRTDGRIQLHIHAKITTENGKKIVKTVKEEVITSLPLVSSAINVDLNLEHRQKGLLWYSTYRVSFSGLYGFHNPSDKEQVVDFQLNFPTTQAIYDDLVFTIEFCQNATTPTRRQSWGRLKLLYR